MLSLLLVACSDSEQTPASLYGSDAHRLPVLGDAEKALLLDLAERHRAAAGAARILALRVEVGALSGVVPEALAAAFPLCAHGTPAADAELRLERSGGRELVLRDMEVI